MILNITFHLASTLTQKVLGKLGILAFSNIEEYDRGHSVCAQSGEKI
jgi:hypothetical protein